MEISSATRWSLVVTAVAGLVYLGWVFASRQDSTARWAAAHQRKTPAETAQPADDGSVKILQFYARDGVIPEGGSTVLCYGVLNARMVRMEPAVETVFPSRNRCFDIRPQRETRYTLTAEGADGRTVAASFSVRVTAAPATLPKISHFRIESCSRDYTGKAIFSLSFADQNGEEISIDPPVFPTLHRSPFGHFYASPSKATTYTLTVTGKSGQVARQQLTVDPANCK